MCFAGCYHIVVRFFFLHHLPHRLYVFWRVSPIALRVYVSEVYLVPHSFCNHGNRLSNFFCYECSSAPWTFMVKEDSVAYKHVVRLTIIYRCIPRKHFCRGVGASRMKPRHFILRRGGVSKHFGA